MELLHPQADIMLERVRQAKEQKRNTLAVHIQNLKQLDSFCKFSEKFGLAEGEAYMAGVVEEDLLGLDSLGVTQKQREAGEYTLAQIEKFIDINNWHSAEQYTKPVSAEQTKDIMTELCHCIIATFCVHVIPEHGYSVVINAFASAYNSFVGTKMKAKRGENWQEVTGETEEECEENGRILQLEFLHTFINPKTIHEFITKHNKYWFLQHSVPTIDPSTFFSES